MPLQLLRGVSDTTQSLPCCGMSLSSILTQGSRSFGGVLWTLQAGPSALISHEDHKERSCSGWPCSALKFRLKAHYGDTHPCAGTEGVNWIPRRKTNLSSQTPLCPSRDACFQSSGQNQLILNSHSKGKFPGLQPWENSSNYHLIP